MYLLKAPVCLLWSCFPTDPYCVGSVWVAVTVYTYTHPGSLHWEVELPVPDVGIHSWTLWYVALRDLSCSNSGSQTCSRCIVMSLDLFPPSFSFLSFLPPSLSSLPLFPPSLSFLPPSLSPLPLFPLSLSFPSLPLFPLSPLYSLPLFPLQLSHPDTSQCQSVISHKTTKELMEVGCLTRPAYPTFVFVLVLCDSLLFSLLVPAHALPPLPPRLRAVTTDRRHSDAPQAPPRRTSTEAFLIYILLHYSLYKQMSIQSWMLGRVHVTVLAYIWGWYGTGTWVNKGGMEWGQWWWGVVWNWDMSKQGCYYGVERVHASASTEKFPSFSNTQFYM